MSYILDALRRADAERERGAVPSLHTQQYGALPGDDDEAPRPPRLLLTIIAALIVALGSALAWNYWGGSDATRRAAAQGKVAAPPDSSPATHPAPLAITPSAPIASPAPAAAPPPLAPASPTPLPLPAAGATAAAIPDARRRLNEAAAQLTTPNRHRASRAEAGFASAPTAGSGQGRLPDALRRELPALAFGGASYSSDPASRMVIFNGRVFHEGDTIAPQLVLQQIKLKAAIFTYKGFRYEIEF
jgi:general secretion pathway protein B